MADRADEAEPQAKRVKSEDGEVPEYIELSNKRRLEVNVFKGRILGRKRQEREGKKCKERKRYINAKKQGVARGRN